jgi:cytochrome P450
VELPGGVQAWAVTSLPLLKKLLKDPQVSKDPDQHWTAWIQGRIPADWPLITWVAVENMFTAYGGDHRRLRTLVSQAFTPRRTADLQPRIRAITTARLDHLTALAAANPGQPVDLREHYAYQIPLLVICELFGVPADQHRELREIAASTFKTSAAPEEVTATWQRLITFFAGLIATKRAFPGDDLTSALITARDQDGSRLSEDELLYTLSLMLVAGHETTVNLIDNTITLLDTHPQQLHLLRNGDAPWDEAVEEALRLEAPLANLPLRYAVQDITQGGITIAQGDAILACYAAAGRDPAVHGPTADQFLITRASKEHLAFGHGAHYCLGAPLARMEAVIALSALYTRFPHLTLAVPAGKLPPLDSMIGNGHTTLPVHLHGHPATTA